MPDGTVRTFGAADAERQTALHVKDWRFFRRILLDGDIGFAEAYMDGDCDSPDLPTERWTYVWNYTPGKVLTIVATAFIGLFFMDFNAYGFDVGFGRDGRIRTISEVGPRRR